MDLQTESSSPSANPNPENAAAPEGGGAPVPVLTSFQAAAAGRYVAEVMEDSEMTSRIPGVFTLLCCGCCELCALRFLGQRTYSLYREPLPVLRHMMEVLWTHVPEAAREADADWRAQSATTEAGSCVACLGTLQNARSVEFMAPLTDAMSRGTRKYEFDDYSLTLTIPAATITRQFALHYHLLGRYKGVEEYKDIDDVVDIKEAIKWILGYELRYSLDLRFSRDSLFHVGIKFRHPETEKEHEFLYQVPDLDFRPPRKNSNKNKRRKGYAGNNRGDNSKKAEEVEEVSISAVTKALWEVPRSTFVKYGAVPPLRLKEPAKCELTFYHDSIYLAGRYTKYSRELSQSPWVADGTRVSETSVQELIVIPLNRHFMAKEMRFSSSGREDIDVRMLGEGRPFVLEVCDPRRCVFTVNEFMSMQQEINAATTLIQIRDLQRIDKEDSTVIQEGEEDKKKTYRCVVWLAKTITPEELLPLSDMKNMIIDQLTPIRVLHRRSLCVRKRMIYEMSARFVSGHVITLDLTTQAGTYVKEFVHGDLGRTTPNLGLLLGCDADILQLDVLAIDLPFPPRIANPQAPSRDNTKKGPDDHLPRTSS
jgi:tRNA pseudouridine synthase 10